MESDSVSEEEFVPTSMCESTFSSEESSGGKKTFELTGAPIRHACPYPGCFVTFSRPSRLKTHTLIHTGDRPFPCKHPGCDKTYTRSNHLKRHTANAHPVKRKEGGGGGGDVDESSDDDEQVKRQTTSVECQHCPKKFVSNVSLKKHIKVAHSETAKRYPCTECGVTFAKKSWLSHHMAQHTGQLPHKCPTCDKAFKFPNKLRHHQQVAHNIKCKECELPFNNMNELQKHRNAVHKTDQKKKECHVCKLEFSKRHLRQHILTHSDVRDVFHCTYPMCRRTYYFERNLKQHINAYHLGNRFTCSFEGCDAKLSTRGKLAQHMKIMHENLKRPIKPKKKPKSTKKHPKKPIAALLTGAILPREIERSMIVENKTFQLSVPELSQEVRTLNPESGSESSSKEDAIVPKAKPAEQTPQSPGDTENMDSCSIVPIDCARTSEVN